MIILRARSGEHFYVALLRVDIVMQIRNAVELNTEQEVNGIAVRRSKLP